MRTADNIVWDLENAEISMDVHGGLMDMSVSVRFKADFTNIEELDEIIDWPMMEIMMFLTDSLLRHRIYERSSLKEIYVPEKLPCKVILMGNDVAGYQVSAVE